MTPLSAGQYQGRESGQSWTYLAANRRRPSAAERIAGAAAAAGENGEAAGEEATETRR